MPPLDAQEQAILESVELNEWQSVPNVAQEIERYQRYAQAQVTTLEAISIELSTTDLQALQEVAQQLGIPVSLLMKSVLHQFVVSQSSSQT